MEGRLGQDKEVRVNVARGSRRAEGSWECDDE